MFTVICVPPRNVHETNTRVNTLVLVSQNQCIETKIMITYRDEPGEGVLIFGDNNFNNSQKIKLKNAIFIKFFFV